MTPPEAIGLGDYGQYYFKTALGLTMLREKVLGPDRFDYAFNEYIKHWAFNDPPKRAGEFMDEPPSPGEYRKLATRVVDLHPITRTDAAKEFGAEALIARADRAMYESKRERAGRPTLARAPELAA